MSASISVGDRFSFLTVIGEPVSRSVGSGRKRRLFFPCRCDCGNDRLVPAYALHSGENKSCGCRRGQWSLAARTDIHHGKGTSLHARWKAMNQRCSNPRDRNYRNYGARGITVCFEWASSFVAFRDWANANGFQAELDIDRKDNDKGYEPGNCHWVTRTVNMHNTRRNCDLSAFGETKCLEEWTRDVRCRVARKSISHRIENLGWDAERAISTPSLRTLRAH